MSLALRSLRVLVIGGYGQFGHRLVQRLSADAAFDVVVAGRDPNKAQQLCAQLHASARARLAPAALDVLAQSLLADLSDLAPDVVVHTAGPFAGTDHRVARACLAAGVHYIDIADDRRHVVDVGLLDEQARQAGICVVTGASSVPAVSGAVVEHLARGLHQVSGVEIGISPGWRDGRGVGTVRSVLARCGTPIEHADGGRETVWGRAWRHRYPAPVGMRWLSPLDGPDIELLPRRFGQALRVRFAAGVEPSLLHLSLCAMASLRCKLGAPDWAPMSGFLHGTARRLGMLGTRRGAMHVSVDACSSAGLPVRRTWALVADGGDGPHVPTLAVSALLRRLHEGRGPRSGAMPCVGLVGLEEIAREAAGLQITLEEVSPNGSA